MLNSVDACFAQINKNTILKHTTDSIYFTGTYSVEVFDSYGNCVLKMKTNRIYVGNLKKGAYYLSAGGYDKQFIKRDDKIIMTIICGNK
ncbi:MAG: hypothetical protein ACHQF2_02425 [Flavobacteriales bacterium]